jgi:Uncharacterized conserved protein (DUF2075)
VPAYYSRTVGEFLQTRLMEIIGELTDGNARFGFPHVEREQSEAWREELAALQEQLSQLCTETPAASAWGLLLEFPIPRRQQRIDAVLLAGELIFVLEFKSGRGRDNWSALRQVEDYALDLSYFHAPSRDRVIFPLLVAPDLNFRQPEPTCHKVKPVTRAATQELASCLRLIFEANHSSGERQISLAAWNEGLYEPVPTVLEAAMALYGGMSVREITRSHAGIHNLTKTTDFILRTVVEAQRKSQKVICFVTGIPGAGKTLVGLNLVHNPEIYRDGRPASVFMSGNGPLVQILREALALDCAQRTHMGKGKARNDVKTFVQNIHHFTRDNLERPHEQAPYEHAIVFDEAQRAWSAERNRKKYRERAAVWHISEPDMVLKVMDRHPDWAAVIALVGGGQEIHDGEAGLAEWGDTLRTKYSHWRVIASAEALDGGESVAGRALLSDELQFKHVTKESALHLDTCIRSHQAEDLATWVNRVLEGDATGAARLSEKFGNFPILLSRDLPQAKTWLLQNARGHRRCGLVASSGAVRLRAYGIETSMAIREAYSYPQWFLAPRGDVRSSYQLETVATEFEIQGLELDFVGLCWGGDFTWDKQSNAWRHAEFKGDKWKHVTKQLRVVLVKNKYRVLMTRSREGLLIWVPRGSADDATQDVGAMDDTAEYLIRCGAVRIS